MTPFVPRAEAPMNARLLAPVAAIPYGPSIAPADSLRFSRTRGGSAVQTCSLTREPRSIVARLGRRGAALFRKSSGGQPGAEQ
jgi:hypothetical protein